MRRVLCRGKPITAQSRCSSMSLPPLMAHKRPALPKWSRGRLGAQPNRAIASQPSPAARSAQFSGELKKLLQSSTNCRQRCRGTSLGGRSGWRQATPGPNRLEWDRDVLARPGFEGAFALSWQSPPPLTASSKSSPNRPYAERFLRAFEYLDMRDGLPFAEQSCRSGSRLEFGDA